jgi:hypothetical protein
VSLPLRHRLLAAAAFGTAVATGYVANLDESASADAGVSAALVRPASAGAVAGAVAGAPGRGSAVERGAWAAPSADALRAWGQEQPLQGVTLAARVAPSGAPGTTQVRAPDSVAAPASVPAAAEPPPPWRYIGRISEGGWPRAMLATAQQLQVVAESDTLDGRWRVARIDADAVELRSLTGERAVRLGWDSP